MVPYPGGYDGADAGSSADLKIEGMLLDVDYLNKGDDTYIRLTIKGRDGKAYELFDTKFKPYFYLLPKPRVEIEGIERISIPDNGKTIKSTRILKEEKMLLGKSVTLYKVFVRNPAYVPKLSAALAQYGTCYECDIPFAKRYIIDKEITPLTNYAIGVRKENEMMTVESFEGKSDDLALDLNVVCFDIEVYNPLQIPMPSKDPIIMISYSHVKGGKVNHGVITYKKIEAPFVVVVKDEPAMLKAFMEKLEEFDADLVVGYNSANFDIKYMLERAAVLHMDLNLSRFEGGTRIESHGLVDKVKIGGRVHVDMYPVVKFIAVVGTAEYILKLNRYTLKDVYEAISPDKKFVVDKAKIYQMWDGGAAELERLATYNLNDADALQKVYDSFIAVMVELSRISCNVLSDVCVSTTGQLVEFMLMRNSEKFGELIPNKPSERETRERLMNQFEGAYVKMPEPGIYDRLAVFDFRGLYPSIIISHNIDPSSICTECSDYYESPTGARFDKNRKSIMPLILRYLVEQRAAVKKAYKKDPDNIFLGSRSQAFKILSNSFYGYLGYARSRWYSRECASSVTAYARQYIKDAMSSAEGYGLKVIYGDTDSVILLLEEKSKDDAIRFMKEFNSKLPESMELELEDFYTRGVFVGKRMEKGAGGAKKKYALISESGRVKIRGFELVRRDWSRIARETQRKVLETILKEGNQQKAADIVKNVINDLREGRVPLDELVISTQLRKGMDSYDLKSPELGAAMKAVKQGFKTKEELEHSVIGYIITKHGSSISEKAELDGMAKDYDADYYINNQVIPATMRILKELNFNADELKNFGTQKKL
jgi:DNA polymerase I